MSAIIDVILHAGSSAVELALYTLLPIMVVMMVLLRFLENHGVLDKLVKWLAPVFRPFGLTGLGILAMIQITFVSFVAPLPTLALMEDQGVADRYLAASFAAILAMAPANSVFPLAAFGLDVPRTLLLSSIGGLIAASCTYWIFGRRLSAEPVAITAFEAAAKAKLSVLQTINLGGSEAIKIVINIIPMLILSLAIVVALQKLGAIEAMSELLAPALHVFGLSKAYILPTLTKYLAGTTALVGVVNEMRHAQQFGPDLLNQSSGFLLHPLDLPGVAILVSAGPRLARTLPAALAGGLVAIGLRALATFLLT